MPVNAAKLPEEILYLILNRPELDQSVLVLVCRSWYNVCIKRLYSELFIPTKQKVRSVSINKNLAACVKEVTYSCDNDNCASSLVLPNLQKLHLNPLVNDLKDRRRDSLLTFLSQNQTFTELDCSLRVLQILDYPRLPALTSIVFKEYNKNGTRGADSITRFLVEQINIRQRSYKSTTDHTKTSNNNNFLDIPSLKTFILVTTSWCALSYLEDWVPLFSKLRVEVLSLDSLYEKPKDVTRADHAIISLFREIESLRYITLQSIYLSLTTLKECIPYMDDILGFKFYIPYDSCSDEDYMNSFMSTISSTLLPTAKDLEILCIYWRGIINPFPLDDTVFHHDLSFIGQKLQILDLYHFLVNPEALFNFVKDMKQLKMLGFCANTFGSTNKSKNCPDPCVKILRTLKQLDSYGVYINGEHASFKNNILVGNRMKMARNILQRYPDYKGNIQDLHYETTKEGRDRKRMKMFFPSM